MGDPKQPVDGTMQVIGAILGPRGRDFPEVTRATADDRDPAYKGYFDAWLDTQELCAMPVVPTQGVVCRDDLLFELELDAGRSGIEVRRSEIEGPDSI